MEDMHFGFGIDKPGFKVQFNVWNSLFIGTIVFAPTLFFQALSTRLVVKREVFFSPKTFKESKAACWEVHSLPQLKI